MLLKPTRRQFLQASASLSSLAMLDGCAAAFEAVIHAASVFFMGVAEHMVADILTPYVEPLVEGAIRELRNPDLLVQNAKEAGANPDISLAVAKVSGEDFTNACLKNGTIIWCQYNKNVSGVNSFTVDISNNSDESKGGQIRFALRNEDGSDDRIRFWAQPFLVAARSNAKLAFSSKGVYLKNIGNKKIVPISYPEGLQIDSVNLTVVPLAMSV